MRRSDESHTAKRIRITAAKAGRMYAATRMVHAVHSNGNVYTLNRKASYTLNRIAKKCFWL